MLREAQGVGQLENKVSLGLGCSSWRRGRQEGKSVRGEEGQKLKEFPLLTPNIQLVTVHIKEQGHLGNDSQFQC